MDRKIQGFDIEEEKNRDLLYALLRTIMNGTRKITNVEKQSLKDGKHSVYITSESIRSN